MGHSQVQTEAQPAMSTFYLEEAARYVGLHEMTLLTRARAGKIPGAAKPGKRWIFRREGLDAYLNQHSPCPYTVEPDGGGSTSPRTQAELESLLGLPTGKKRRNTTKSEKVRYGGGTNSAKQSR
jgi:excisionase family DNA binding protein